MVCFMKRGARIWNMYLPSHLVLEKIFCSRYEPRTNAYTCTYNFKQKYCSHATSQYAYPIIGHNIKSISIISVVDMFLTIIKFPIWSNFFINFILKKIHLKDSFRKVFGRLLVINLMCQTIFIILWHSMCYDNLQNRRQ